MFVFYKTDTSLRRTADTISLCDLLPDHVDCMRQDNSIDTTWFL